MLLQAVLILRVVLDTSLVQRRFHEGIGVVVQRHHGSSARTFVYDLNLAEVIPFLEPPDLGFLALGITDTNLAFAFADIIEASLKLFRDVALGNHSQMRDTKMSLQFRN